MSGGDRPYAAIPGGARLTVRLSPRASRDAVEGVALDAAGKPVLKIRLTVPPVEDAANAALIAFLADALKLRKTDIAIHSGETARLKVLYLSGDSGALLAKLAALCA